MSRKHSHGAQAHDANKLCPKGVLIDKKQASRQILKKIHKKKSRAFAKLMILNGAKRYYADKE